MNQIQKVFKIRILNDDVYFKVVFLLWSLVHYLGLGQYYTSYLSPIILLWGSLLIIKNIFVDKVRFSKKYFILIFIFLLSYSITILINRDLNFIGNIKTLIWQSIMMISLFINDFNKDKEKIFNDISRISRAIVIASLIVSGISLMQFFFNINFWIDRVDGVRIPQGYYAARLWGIYIDPNQSCNVAIVSLAMSGILLLSKKTINKFILILNIVVEYLLIVLSGSRGGEIGLALFLIGILYIIIEKLLVNRVRAITMRGIFSIFLSIILTGTIILSLGTTRRVLALIPEMGFQIRSGSLLNTGDDVEHITVERPDTKTSNGRIELWQDSLKLSKSFPIFGVGDRNIMIVAKNLMPESPITKQYVHNGYIHALLSGGILGLLIIMILLAYMAIPCIKNILSKKKYNNEYYIYSIMAIMIASILLTTVFLTEIFYQNSFTAAIFWIFTGYIVYLDKNNNFVYK
jgi:O-antigen ligase